MGWKDWAAASAACVVLAGCDAPATSTPATGSSGDADAPAAAQKAEFDGCPAAKAADVVERTKSRGLVDGQEPADDGIVLIVNAYTWRALGLEGQKAVLVMYDCHLAGDDHHLTRIHVRQDRDGPDLFTAQGYELMDWRRLIWPSADALQAYEAAEAKAAP